MTKREQHETTVQFELRHKRFASNDEREAYRRRRLAALSRGFAQSNQATAVVHENGNWVEY